MTDTPAATALCCDCHGRNCEPPAELCCNQCTEARHAGWTDSRGRQRHGHPAGETCSNPDLSPATIPATNGRTVGSLMLMQRAFAAWYTSMPLGWQRGYTDYGVAQVAHTHGWDNGFAAGRAEGERNATAGTDGASRITAERKRQISAEGYTPEHDREHVNGELARAAATYATASVYGSPRQGNIGFPGWPVSWVFKPASRIRMLVKAGAFIAAEIDRLLAADQVEAPSADHLHVHIVPRVEGDGLPWTPQQGD